MLMWITNLTGKPVTVGHPDGSSLAIPPTGKELPPPLYSKFSSFLEGWIFRGELEIHEWELPAHVYTGKVPIFFKDTLWGTISVPYNSSLQPATGARRPDVVQILNDGAGSRGIYGLSFRNGGNEDELFFGVIIPPSYKEETNLFPFIHWMPSDGNAGNVVWGLEYSWQGVGDIFANTTTIIANGSTGVLKQHTATPFTPIPGDSQLIASMIIGRLFRDSNDSNDTYTNNALLLEFDFHYQRDIPDSRDVLTK